MAINLAALDPRNFKPIQVPDPVKRFKTLADARGMMQDEELRNVQIERAEAELSSYRKQLQDADTVKAILAETGGDYEAALPRLFQVAPEVAMKIKQASAVEKKTKSDEARQIRDDKIKALEIEGKMFGDMAQAGRDEQAYQLRVREQEERERTSAWQRIKPEASDRTLTPFEVWRSQNPESPVADWMKLEADNKPKPQSGEPLVPVDDGLGNVTYVPRSQAAGARVPSSSQNKPSTGVEKRVLNFYIRAKDGKKTLDSIESDIGKLGTFEQGKLKFAPNIMQSDLGQAYTQAQRAFIEAYLRKDSGAAIPPNEYVEAAKTYFAQPGDTKATLANKKRGRDAIMEGLKVESGRAYKEHYGEESGGGSGGGSLIVPGGALERLLKGGQ